MHALKTLTRRRCLRLAAAPVASTAFPRLVHARTWPTKPARMIVPFAPGGTTDIFARLLSQKLTEQLGMQFHVENMAGASGDIGTGYVAKAAPDGYTILLADTSYVVNPSLLARASYHVRDFEPVTLAVSSPTVLSVGPFMPATTVDDLVTLIKANPGKYNFASAGVGTQAHLVGERFRLSLGLDLGHVPHDGGGPAMTSVVAGHSAFIFGTLAAALRHLRTGKLRALAIAGKARSQILSDVPTMNESGYPEIEVDSWLGLLVPVTTPNEIVAAMHGEFIDILTLPAMKERLATIGFDLVASTPAEFAQRINVELETYGKIIRAANIKVE
jgi:tripartite-type tricarboxylate transporter receptor subunit TctC